jgi:thymidylate kinase
MRRQSAMIVAIEGVDGSGKTTQAKILAESLIRQGYQSKYIRPSNLIIKEDDRPHIFSPRQVKTRKTNKLKKIVITIFGYPYALCSLILIRLFAIRKNIVIADRYFYQFIFDIYGSKSIGLLNLLPRPDIIFILNGDQKVLHSRRNDLFDREVSLSYYTAVDNFYKEAQSKQSAVAIDALSDIKIINERILNYVLERIR